MDSEICRREEMRQYICWKKDDCLLEKKTFRQNNEKNTYIVRNSLERFKELTKLQ